MNVLVLLIFASLGMALLFLLAFIWAVSTGQYEDTATPSMRVLTEDLLNRQAKTNFKPNPDKKTP